MTAFGRAPPQASVALPPSPHSPMEERTTPVRSVQVQGPAQLVAPPPAPPSPTRHELQAAAQRKQQPPPPAESHVGLPLRLPVTALDLESRGVGWLLQAAERVLGGAPAALQEQSTGVVLRAGSGEALRSLLPGVHPGSLRFLAFFPRQVMPLAAALRCRPPRGVVRHCVVAFASPAAQRDRHVAADSIVRDITSAATGLPDRPPDFVLDVEGGVRVDLTQPLPPSADTHHPGRFSLTLLWVPPGVQLDTASTLREVPLEHLPRVWGVRHKQLALSHAEVAAGAGRGMPTLHHLASACAQHLPGRRHPDHILVGGAALRGAPDTPLHQLGLPPARHYHVHCFLDPPGSRITLTASQPASLDSPALVSRNVDIPFATAELRNTTLGTLRQRVEAEVGVPPHSLSVAGQCLDHLSNDVTLRQAGLRLLPELHVCVQVDAAALAAQEAVEAARTAATLARERAKAAAEAAQKAAAEAGLPPPQVEGGDEGGGMATPPLTPRAAHATLGAALLHLSSVAEGGGAS